MTNTNSSTYSPAAAWNTLLQPFYVLSTVIGILIGTSILALAIRGCARRTAARRRFVRAVDSGWAVPVFNISDDTNAGLEANNVNGTKPIMRESVLNLNGGVRVDGGMWEQALPLSMTLLPTPSSRPHDLLLYLLRSPSILTSNLFSRLRAIQFVRSNQTHYHHRFLAPSGNNQSPGQQSAAHNPPTLPASPHPRSKERTSEVTAREPVQVMFVVAMPRPPPPLRPRVSPATAHEPAIQIANQELCIGVVSASLQVPVQHLKSRREEQAVAIRHGNVQEVVEEEVNYASTTHSRRVRSEDPGHEVAGSFVSSRHMHVANYGDEESLYMSHRTASASPSYWEDYGGAAGGGSTHDTHNSYLTPPSIRYRPSAQGHRGDDLSSINNQQPQVHNDQARSGDDSDYPPSRVYTPSLVGLHAPSSPPDASAPPASPTPPPLPLQPRVLIGDPEPSLAAPGDMASQQSHGSELDSLGLAAHRDSQFTSTTNTTASATDVEGGYDADADAGRRLSLKPRGATRRRAGS